MLMISVIPTSEQPPVYPQQSTHYQESPFSFVSSALPSNYESLHGDSHEYLAHHDAAVSLPSSSGGLDALLNSPRPIGTSGQSKLAGVFTKTDTQAIPDVLEIGSYEESTPYPRQASVLTEVDHLALNSVCESSRHCSTSLKAMASSETISSSTAAEHSPRKARVEAERGRRDELRDRFARLKDILPMAGRKGSKINILDKGGSEMIDNSRAVC